MIHEARTVHQNKTVVNCYLLQEIHIYLNYLLNCIIMELLMNVSVTNNHFSNDKYIFF